MPTSKVMTVPMRTYQGHAMAAKGERGGVREGKAVDSGLANVAIVAIAIDIPGSRRANAHIPRKKRAAVRE